MFTITDSEVSDYGFLVTPISAGTVDSNGMLTLAEDASGDVKVTCVNRFHESVAADTMLMNVVPKVVISGKTVNGKIGGDKVFFTEMFTSNTASSSFSYEVTPTTDVSINTTTGVLTLGDNASGTYTIKATHRTQTSATATATVVNVVPKAGLSGMSFISKFGGNKVFFANSFNNFVNSTAADYNYSVVPSSAATNVLADSFVLADNASGLVEIIAVNKTQPSVTATTKLIDVAPKVVITAKTVSNKVGGDVVPFADMFTSNYAASTFNYSITPVEAGTVSSAGVLTLAADPGDELISIKATHKSQITATATCNIVATPKLVGFVVQGVTNAVAVGDINLPSVTDTMTITNPAQPGVFRIDTVFQGALLGKVMYDLAGSEVSKIESVSISGDLLTITLNEPLFSDDTSITLRTDPGSTVFRTYLLYSGE